MSKAVIYARYSCDNQREESIEGQLRECKAFAERKGYIVVDMEDLFDEFSEEELECLKDYC